MIEEKNEVEFSILLLITILMNLLAIVIPSYFLYFYIKLKELHSFVCGHIIALSFSILLNNLIKLIPLGSDEKYKTFQYIQAFLLESLDKFILFILVGQAFILYIGDTYINFYSKFKRHIFFSSLFGCSGLSFLIGRNRGAEKEPSRMFGLELGGRLVQLAHLRGVLRPVAEDRMRRGKRQNGRLNARLVHPLQLRLFAPLRERKAFVHNRPVRGKILYVCAWQDMAMHVHHALRVREESRRQKST